MKILIEPPRLGKLLSTVLIYKGKPLLDTVVGEFSPKGVIFRDMKLEVAAIYALYTPKFFLEYEVEENEEVPLTATLLNRLGWGFRDEKISLATNEEDLILKGSKEIYKERMMETEKGEFTLKVKSSKYGFISAKEPIVRVQLPAESLTLPSAEKYLFDCDGKKLVVTIENVGKYTKTLKPTKKTIMEKIAVSFDGAYFGQLISNISGSVWLSLTDGGVIFSQKTKDYALTYLLSSMEE